jgi:4-alpha-glucanotransferase
MDVILEQAALRGIETEYTDAGGQRRIVGEPTIARLIEAIPVEANRQRRIFPTVVVVRRGQMARIGPSKPWQGHIRWELIADGSTRRGESPTPHIALPRGLPLGTFDLRIDFFSPQRESETVTLLVAPGLAYQGDDESARMWVLAVQLYGVRSRRNWGHGDFTDLAKMVDLAAELGAAGIGLNPLHDIFEASPYSPSSRLFLNPLYIDVETVPGFPGFSAALEQDLEALRSRHLVDYLAVRRIKLRALRLAHEVFRETAPAAEKDDLQRFRQERTPILQRFACFELLRRRYASPWWDWPEPWRNPADRDLDRLSETEPDEVGFSEFLQWQADRQLRACRDRAGRAGMPLGLYLDIAVGVRPDGFDAWNSQASMLMDVAIGAPPDMLNAGGQNWSLAATNPLYLEAGGFESFRSVLRSSMRYAGAVRLDHVLGLNRLFLIPSGSPATQGTYVRLPFEPLLAVIAQESAQNRCILIGEDLGTVPEHFRETLVQWGVWSYQVMLFQRDANGHFLPPESYRKNAVAAFATHDLPTFAGWADGRDLVVATALGITPGETTEERKQSHQALRDALSRRQLRSFEFSSVARYLAYAPTRLVAISMEDALGIQEQVNVPGISDGHPNWCLRLPVNLEDLEQQRGLIDLAKAMRSAGRSATPK